MIRTTFCISLLLLFGNLLFASDYFWVGGSGNWSDISHWATTSGGSTFHTQAPTSEDNVFFDGNSFNNADQTVAVNTDIIFCRNMDWTGAVGNPIFTGSVNQTLNVHGSIILNVNMTFGFEGTIRLLAIEAGRVIDAAGNTFGKNVIFSGNGGEWTLQNALQVDSMIQLANGILRTGDWPITTAYLRVASDNSATLSLGNSTVTLNGSTFSASGETIAAFSLRSNNVTLEAAGASIELTSTQAGIDILEPNTIAIGKIRFSGSDGQSNIQVETGGSLEVDSLLFSNSGDISGSLTTGHLSLAPGKAYIFESGQTYPISSIDAPGECRAPIQLFGSISGTAAILSSDSGPIQVSYVSLKDVQSLGGANFTTENSADLGNNDGWTFNNTVQNDLYWVGGSGNWDDSNHWSFTSGGPGGACVPTGADNVFFDAGSFSSPGDTVTINVENALCNNMDWSGATGTPALDGPLGSKIRIYGSLKMIQAMDLAFSGDFHFESSAPGNAITTGNLLFRHNVYFNGSGGAWSLNDSLNVESFIELESGFLTTNSQTVVCERFLSLGSYQRQLLLGSSHIIMRQLDFSGGINTCQFWLQKENLVFDAGSSRIDFIQYGQLRTDGNGSVSYFEVNFSWYGTVRNHPNASVYVHHLAFMEEGSLLNGFSMGTLALAPAFEYYFASGETFTINELEASGSCDALIYMHSITDDLTAYIDGPNNLSGDYLILRDLNNVSGKVFTANNSIDEGNNQAWTFDELGARTLYWVGGGGNWSDRAHWSLSSGGPGGECIPTSVDDVFFDENSFDQPGQVVTDSLPKHFCHDITWQNISTGPAFNVIDLLVFGSLEFAEDMTVDIVNVRFQGDDPGQTINTRGHLVRYTNFDGAGAWTLTEDFNGIGMSMSHGGLHTDGFSVNLEYFNTYGDEVSKELTLGGSHILLSGEKSNPAWEASGNITIQADSSLIELTGTRANFYNRNPNGGIWDFNRVLFSARAGNSAVSIWNTTTLSFNHLQINNNGTIYGGHTYDTLIFAPGKSYQLEAMQTQTIVDHWQITGNNCVPIQLSSTAPGEKSTTYMAKGQVNGNFIQMRDQEATGGADFFAGAYSTNEGDSNTGWIFDSADDFADVGFLGKDVIDCDDRTVVLDADNKGAEETYLWHNGSTEASFTVPGPGSYWAEVSFANNCTIRDSIKIIPQEDFLASIGSDTTLCTGYGLVLDASFDALGVTYQWQDGSTTSTFLVNAPGEYKVELELSGCMVRDSLMVDYYDPPAPDLGTDQTLCHGITIGLDATIAEAVGYRWQDGSAGPGYTIAAPGTYWVDYDFDHCVLRDSVTIDYYPEIGPDLGADTTLCETDLLVLDASLANASYTWQDGSTASGFTATKGGIYWVDVTVDGCTERDSLQAFYNPVPVFDLGPELRPCENEAPRLSANVSGAVYAWQDGSSQAGFDVSANGIYWLDVTMGGCTSRDSVAVDYIILPKEPLGEDLILCDGEEVRFDLDVPGGIIRWQDGAISSDYTVTTTGDYSVEITVEQCSERDEVSIAFNPTPFFSLQNDTLLCEGETLRLNAGVPADDFRWSDGSAGSNLQVSYPGGLIWAEARYDECPFRDTIMVNYLQPPVLELGQDTLICEDFDVMLTANVPGDSYLWHDGSTESRLRSAGPGLYSLELTDGPCTVTDSVFIATRPCIYFDVFVPNAFSPNGDGINDILQPMLPAEVQISNYQWKIYDRWGTEIFSTSSLEEGWDGKFRSSSMAMGVYIYFVEFEYTDDRGTGKELLSGDVMLMR